MINILFYQIIAFTRHGKISKSYPKEINLKNLLQHGITNLNYLMDHIMYLRFETNFSESLKYMKQLLKIHQ